eukprot:TRINITY_DN4539_c0_g5_i1.p1 TRINITY_DN4539_c0_g5~~TRINITY_DN4539_c0_g5_i1.p1  ORF type:complete len:419 (-),score=22.81 TRINITY_DN4539_c0_g5_i1:36-1292(-)
MAHRGTKQVILSFLVLLLYTARATRSSIKKVHGSLVADVAPTLSKGSAPHTRQLKDFYRKRKQIGKGGYGKVFLATQILDLRNQTKTVGPSNQVVIKEVQYDRYKDVEDEVMALKLPFVADMEAKFTETNVKVSLVTRYYEGGDVLDLVMDRERINDTDLVKLWGSQMAYGLWQLHRNQVLYGDLKLENTFITAGNVVLADFGLSTRPCPNKRGWACQKKVKGTPAYVTPSILSKEPYGYEIDWWALGVALYLMEEGKSPPSELVTFLENILMREAFKEFETDEARKRMVDRASEHPILKHPYWHGQTDAKKIEEYWFDICKNHSLHKEKCVPVTAPPLWSSNVQASADTAPVGENASDDAELQDDDGCVGADCDADALDDSSPPYISQYPARGMVCYGRECNPIGNLRRLFQARRSP